MKLYTMECIYDPETAENPFSPGILGQKEYFVKIENKDEFKVYERTHNNELDESGQTYNEGYWDCYMTEQLGYMHSEGSTYYYFMPLDNEIKVGEIYTDTDRLVWKRVE